MNRTKRASDVIFGQYEERPESVAVPAALILTRSVVFERVSRIKTSGVPSVSVTLTRLVDLLSKATQRPSLEICGSEENVSAAGGVPFPKKSAVINRVVPASVSRRKISTDELVSLATRLPVRDAKAT